MSTDLCLEGDGDEEVPSPPDPAASLAAISWCLRAVAQGWALHPAERAAAIALLEGGISGAPAADLEAATKILASSRRLGSRQRDRAAELSVRLAGHAAAVVR